MGLTILFDSVLGAHAPGYYLPPFQGFGRVRSQAERKPISQRPMPTNPESISMFSPIHTQQPEARGGRSSESVPQVVVRAGKTWICSACGVLVEVPADVVGQLVVVPEQAAPEEPAQASPAHESPTHEPPEPTPPAVSAETEPAPRALARPSQAIDPSRQRVDGLTVPTPREMHRLLAWIDYRLRRLKDLQGEENALTRLRMRGPCCGALKHAQEDLGVAPGMGRKRGGSWKGAVPLRGRNWGVRRHAQADLGAAPNAGNAFTQRRLSADDLTIGSNVLEGTPRILPVRTGKPCAIAKPLPRHWPGPSDTLEEIQQERDRGPP